MLRLFGWAPLHRVARVQRAFLRVENLEGRAHPSGLEVPPVTAPGQEYHGTPADNPPPITGNQPPEIVDFGAVEVSNGVFLVTGRVVDEHPGGITVTLGGVPSARGISFLTESDGSFSYLLRLQTDGSDTGCLTVTVTDDAGLSDEDFQYVFPTAP